MESSTDIIPFMDQIDSKALTILAQPDYQEMVSYIDNHSLAIQKTTQIFNKSQSQFMDNMLTVSHLTPFRNLRQILAEMKRTRGALAEAYFNLEKKKIDIQIKERELNDETDPLLRKKLEIEITEMQYQIDSSMEYVGGAIRKLANYTAQFKAIEQQLPDLSEQAFEEEEERYHISKAFEQGLHAARAHGGYIDEGNQIYFHQIGINGTAAQIEMTKYLNKEYALINDPDNPREPSHEMEVDWIMEMTEKFKGCAMNFAKRKGMDNIVTEFACTGWDDYRTEQEKGNL